MNIKKYYYFFLIIILFFVIYIFFQYNYFTNNKREPFISGVREMYRPYMRDIRISGENYYNKIKDESIVKFRKIGLI
jgi:hypothetical protein